MDGRYYGRPIVSSGRSCSASDGRVVSGSRFQSSAARAVDAADGVLDGKYFGRPIVEGGTYGGSRVLSARGAYGGSRLLSARGAYGGSRLLSARGAYGGGGVLSAGGLRSDTALALDAADGVIDGRYQGFRLAPIWLSAPSGGPSERGRGLWTGREPERRC